MVLLDKVKEGELEFKLIESNTSGHYYDCGLGYDESVLYVSLRYLTNNNELSILQINSGDLGKVKNLTGKTLDLFISQFDVNSISFRDVYEKSTYGLLKNMVLSGYDDLKIDSIPDFQKSPFLRNLYSLGFKNVILETDCVGDEFFIDNLVGYK